MYKRHRFLPKLVQYAVWLYHRFSLSHRDIEDLLRNGVSPEELIQRKWADISAETAGEQYIPDDVIALNRKMLASEIEESDRLLKIYEYIYDVELKKLGIQYQLFESL